MLDMTDMTQGPIVRTRPHPDAGPWMTPEEAAVALAVSTRTLARWSAPGGKLRVHFTNGGHRRYDRKQIISMLPDWATEDE